MTLCVLLEKTFTCREIKFFFFPLEKWMDKYVATLRFFFTTGLQFFTKALAPVMTHHYLCNRNAYIVETGHRFNTNKKQHKNECEEETIERLTRLKKIRTRKPPKSTLSDSCKVNKSHHGSG